MVEFWKFLPITQLNFVTVVAFLRKVENVPALVASKNWVSRSWSFGIPGLLRYHENTFTVLHLEDSIFVAITQQLEQLEWT